MEGSGVGEGLCAAAVYQQCVPGTFGLAAPYKRHSSAVSSRVRLWTAIQLPGGQQGIGRALECCSPLQPSRRASSVLEISTSAIVWTLLCSLLSVVCPDRPNGPARPGLNW